MPITTQRTPEPGTQRAHADGGELLCNSLPSHDRIRALDSAWCGVVYVDGCDRGWVSPAEGVGLCLS